MGKLDVSMKKWEKNPAMLRIIRMFEDAFNSIGEKIRTDLLKAYRARKDPIFEGVPEGSYATHSRVTSAVYYKHKLVK